MNDFISNLTDEKLAQAIQYKNDALNKCMKQMVDIKEYIQELKEEQIYRKYGIRKGYVIKDTKTNEMGIVIRVYDWRLTMKLIKKNGNIGKINRNVRFEDIKKLYDSYEEFTSMVDQLCES